MSKTNRNTGKARGSARKKSGKTNVRSFTEFEGETYTGLPGTQTWALNKGQWEEQRTGADTWNIAFSTTAVKPLLQAESLPAGSEHHSYILAHQRIVKTRHNTFQVQLEGVKFKLAHREAEGRWNANAAVRKKNLIRFLRQVLNDLEMGHGQAPSQTRQAPAATEIHHQTGQVTRSRRKNPRD